MNLQIYEEATDWVVKHRNGDLDARAKRSFDAWLRESPHHVLAYLEMSSVWEDVPSLDPGWNASADELIARARSDDNVVPLAALSSSGAEAIGDRPRIADRGDLQAFAQAGDERVAGSAAARLGRAVSGKWRTRVPLTLAASVLMALAAIWLHLQHGVYVTGIGEQRSLALTDGSTVELNSRSRIRVRYSEHERHIDLLEGQALFKVARNRARPFIVQTGDTRVRAVGTAFDIYKKDSGAVVTVVEGRVAVHSERSGGHAGDSSVPADAQTRLLAAGEQLVVTPAAISSPKRANIASATAWTRRSLVFESSPLTDVAQEFNRYNARRLVIDDPQLEAFHVSGVFSSVEPTLLLRFLRAQPELLVQETDTEIRITKK